MRQLFKYRSFDSQGYWRAIFTSNEFWFSIADKLDDEEEVKVQYNLTAHLIDQRDEEKLRRGVSILSLATELNNLELWKVYGDKRRGFCVEVDFQDFDLDNELHLEEIEYVNHSAVATIDMEVLRHCLDGNGEEDQIKIWRALFCQKSKTKWGYQKEIRYLHFKASPPDGYLGHARSIQADRIKRVFIYGGTIAPGNRQELENLIEKYQIDHGVIISLVDLDEPEEGGCDD